MQASSHLGIRPESSRLPATSITISDGVLEIELGGLTVGTEYDRLMVGGSAIFATGGIIEIILIDKDDPILGTNILQPSSGDFFDIMDLFVLPDHRRWAVFHRVRFGWRISATSFVVGRRRC